MSTDSPSSSRRLVQAIGLVVATTVVAFVGPAEGQDAASSGFDNSPRLPISTGIYAVGSQLIHLLDSSRPDTLSQRSGQYREIVAQIWYPSDVPAAADMIPYLPDEGLLEQMIEREYFFQSLDLLQSWAGIRTRAGVGLPVAVGRRPFPILFLSHGLGMSRTQYSSLAHELASHGSVVVAIDHPHGGLSVLPNGQTLSTAGRTELEEPEGIEAEAKRWARDASFVLDRLLEGSDSVAGAPLSARLDPDRVGMLGHSLGGAAAWQACREDPRFRACAGLDGTPVGEFMAEGFGAPTLVLQSAPEYSDADLAAAGRTREAWDEMGHTYDSAWATAIQRSDSPVHRIWLHGFGHSGYGDAPWVMPNAITRFGGRVVGAQRSFELVSTYVRAFFDRYLSDYPTPLLDGPNPLWPEVAFAVPD